MVEISNALTVDLEEWYRGETFTLDDEPFQKYAGSIVYDAEEILKLFKANNVTATFFVLGSVTKKYPEIVEKIVDEGHEVGTHGMNHTLIYKMNKTQFEKEISECIKDLEKITKEKIRGHRAPGFSILGSNSWALEVLEEHGIEYDSSISPVKTPYSGIQNVIKYPYHPDKDDLTKEDKSRKIIEFPLSTFKLGITLPLGGFYLRALPVWISKLGIKKINKTGNPAMIYFHPRDIGLRHPVPRQLPLYNKFIIYYNVKKFHKKLNHLLKIFKFKSIREVLEEICI